MSLNGGFRVPAGRGSEDREYRKLFQGVCYRERLRDGTVSGGACTGRRVLCFKQEQLQAVCMLIGVSQ